MSVIVEETLKVATPKLDYSGAHEKTDHRRASPTGGGVLNAAKDPKEWLCVFMQHYHLGANGFTNCFPTAFNERMWHIIIAKGFAIFGFILSDATLNMGA
ncbi:uncharacterized protein J7T54_008045 [Emericellopsis cladophorae]|uniref:Uncharacterized protein n=1 Tax=Emericellopsis cladophorae TaxID=2686198 RepID=A0A9P9Y7M7_9HYPO|nr:uncharacterized protein J7T54_008045 [Emericellopsis cladophorae]KAI6784951.1 hypothetical protein J7T54_008045 [Emericellopsis cladophorae]